MSGREFLDTNVLVYAEDSRDTIKQTQARDLIRALLLERRGVISLQVLQEFHVVATRKLNMDPEAARRRILRYSRFEIVPLQFPDLLSAIDLQQLHNLSFWDALIVKAALNGSCKVLHSEDMHSGHVIETLALNNPFSSPVMP